MATGFKKITPNIMVEDVNKTVEFYRNVLSFEVLATVPETGQFDWAMLKRDGVEIMFQSRPSLSGELPVFTDMPIAASLTLYTDVEDIVALYNAVKDKVTVVQDMHKTFYGAQEFAIRDINGYILNFAQTTE